MSWASLPMSSAPVPNHHHAASLQQPGFHPAPPYGPPPRHPSFPPPLPALPQQPPPKRSSQPEPLEMDDMAKAMQASEQEYKSTQQQLEAERQAIERIMAESARDAAAVERAESDLSRVAAESHAIEMERQARLDQEEREILNRAMKASAREAKADEAEADAEQEMFELALALSQNVATADARHRRDWAPSISEEQDDDDGSEPSEEVMTEGPLRVLGPRGLSLLWKDGRNHGDAPLTISAPVSRARPLPDLPRPAQPVASTSKLPSRSPRASPAPSRQSSASSPRPQVPPKPSSSRQSSYSSRPPGLPSRSSAPAASSGVPIRAPPSPRSSHDIPHSLPHLPTLATLGANPPTLSSFARPSSSVPSLSVESDDPFGDEHAAPSEVSSQGEGADQVSDLWAATHRPSAPTRSVQRQISSPTLSTPPGPSTSSVPLAERTRRASQPTVSLVERPVAPSRAVTERRPGPKMMTPSTQIFSGDIEQRVSWGFAGSALRAGDGLPDVIQLSNAAGDGKYASFVVQAPTWRSLLRMLMWYGSTRIETSPRDFVDRKSDAPFQCSLILDFTATNVSLSFVLMPSRRAALHRASSSQNHRTLPLPSSPIALPTVLAQIATLLHASLRTARDSHHGPLASLPGEVEVLARAAGEPIAEALEAERGLVDRLRKRLWRHQERRSTVLGEEAIEDSAVLIQPFRIDSS